MNHAIFIIKVVQEPVRSTYCQEEIIEVEVEFPVSKQTNSKREFKLILWGSHKEDFLKYYRIQDYLLVEGIIIVTGQREETEDNVKITVKSLYPFLIE